MTREKRPPMVLLCLTTAVALSFPAASFMVAPSTTFQQQSRLPSFSNRAAPSRQHVVAVVVRQRDTRLFAVDFNSNDPFLVLDLDPTADKKLIKRAYKRLALKYHPDVVTSQASTEQEKRQASDRFAKINWAYATLSGKNSDATSTSTSTSSTAGRSTATGGSSGGGYQPPHRRTGASKTYVSTDWQDYMPKYDEEQYDAGGDSFGKIFSDLFTGVAAGAVGASAAGGGGVFRDFVEFLESNVDGYGGSGRDNDAQLRVLLQTGTLEEVGNEMDDTELVVEQLASKLQNIKNDLLMVRADMKQATGRYMEQLELEERVAELEAREKVVEGYVKKARTRLLALQTRYKELIVSGRNDPKAGGGRSRQQSASSVPYSFDYGSYARGSATSSASSPTSGTSSSTASSTTSAEDDWKREGFGSSGRGRGSSRRRQAAQGTRAGEQGNSSSPSQPPPRQTSSSSNLGDNSRGSSTTSSSSSYVPPHRRTTDNATTDDKKRMREMKVDEEFEKLKRDLGL